MLTNKLRLFLLLFFIVNIKSNKSKKCNETYSSVDIVIETVSEDYTVDKPCPHIQCTTVTKIRTKTAIRYTPKIDFKLTCCEGYKLIIEADQCVPKCSLGCVHGDCINPNICECKPGFKGNSCNETCPTNKWGKNCTNECKCSGNGYCDTKSGTCSCNPGYIGTECENICSNGTFGHNCSSHCEKCPNLYICSYVDGKCEQCDKSHSNDSICARNCHCENEGTCNPVTGQCSCKPGFFGKMCSQPCRTNFYGENCLKTCECKNNMECHPTNGTCICTNGWDGEKCSNRICPESNYGIECRHVCKCNSTNTEICDPYDGKCTCKPGWIGEYCNQRCPYMKFGKNCQSTCQCNKNSKCSPIDGTCDCLYGWNGKFCENECSPRSFGHMCQQNCSCLIPNTDKCDPFNGTCYCKQFWKGSLCNECPYKINGTNCGMELIENIISDKSIIIISLVLGTLILITTLICCYKMFIKVLKVNYGFVTYDAGHITNRASPHLSESRPHQTYGPEPTQNTNLYEEVRYSEVNQNSNIFYDRLDFSPPNTVARPSPNYQICILNK